MHMLCFANEAQAIFHAQPEGKTVDISYTAARAAVGKVASQPLYKNIVGFNNPTPFQLQHLRRLADGVSSYL